MNSSFYARFIQGAPHHRKKITDSTLLQVHHLHASHQNYEFSTTISSALQQILQICYWKMHWYQHRGAQESPNFVCDRTLSMATLKLFRDAFVPFCFSFRMDHLERRFDRWLVWVYGTTSFTTFWQHLGSLYIDTPTYRLQYKAALHRGVDAVKSVGHYHPKFGSNESSRCLTLSAGTAMGRSSSYKRGIALQSEVR